MSAAYRNEDRVVHARSASGQTEVVRYDRQGRWFVEEPQAGLRRRLKTVQQAAEQALVLEDDGGEILYDQPGGGQFDAKVDGAKGRMARNSK